MSSRCIIDCSKVEPGSGPGELKPPTYLSPNHILRRSVPFLRIQLSALARLPACLLSTNDVLHLLLPALHFSPPVTDTSGRSDAVSRLARKREQRGGQDRTGQQPERRKWPRMSTTGADKKIRRQERKPASQPAIQQQHHTYACRSSVVVAAAQHSTDPT